MPDVALLFQHTSTHNVSDDSYTHTPNAETLAAMEEAEEIIRQIKAGARQPKNLEAFLAEMHSWGSEQENIHV